MEKYTKSKYTIGFKIRKKFILFNTLHGTLDEVNEKLYVNLLNGDLNKLNNLNDMHERGYITNKNELNLLNDMYKEFNNNIKKTIQFYIIMSYDCNLKCSYCFEQDINKNIKIDSNNLDMLFLSIINIKNNNENANFEIILYGGEPLLNGNKENIDKILKFCNLNKFQLSVITNGINISKHIDFLINNEMLNKLIITLDGIKEIHDKNRVYKNGLGTFDDIMNSLKILGDKNVKYELRVNLSAENIDFICKFIKDFYSNNLHYNVPINIYKIEDNKCTGIIDNVLKLGELIKTLNKINNLNFIYNNSINICINWYTHLENLIKSEKNIYPLFNYCNYENIYVFDPSGIIYGCTEACGSNEMIVGKFIPKFEILGFEQDKKKIENNQCNRCELAPICGGGCKYKKTYEKNNECIHFNELYEAIKIYIEEYIWN